MAWQSRFPYKTLIGAFYVLAIFLPGLTEAKGHSSGSSHHSSSPRSHVSTGSHASSPRTSTHAPRRSSHATTHSSSAPTTHSSRAAPGVARDSRGRIARSTSAKKEFQKSHPCPANGRTSGPCGGYVVDHVQPLKRGGADSPSNMQWQTIAAAKAKDRVE